MQNSPKQAAAKNSSANAQLRSFYATRRRVVAGLVLTVAIILSWITFFTWGLFRYQWGLHSLVTAPLLIIVLCWLYVGLFIIAHDCMHETLMPRNRWVNRVVGQLCLLLYAGFDFKELKDKHYLHHRHAGSDHDPDFDSRAPHKAWRWYWRFFSEYFSARPVLWMATAGMLYFFVFSAPYSNLLAFWAFPAILSSAQLFYFGTFQPHRPSSEPFVDRHRASTSGYGWWKSLFTCFHFGHHLAHHRHPCVPWWGLHALASTPVFTGSSKGFVGSGRPLSATLSFE